MPALIAPPAPLVHFGVEGRKEQVLKDCEIIVVAVGLGGGPVPFNSFASATASNNDSGTRRFSLMNQTNISRVSSRINAISFAPSPLPWPLGKATGALVLAQANQSASS